MDYIFIGGVPTINSVINAQADDDLMDNYLRSMIYVHYSGISSTDTFRIIVKYGIEYIPTPQFEPFTNYALSNTDTDSIKDL